MTDSDTGGTQEVGWRKIATIGAAIAGTVAALAAFTGNLKTIGDNVSQWFGGTAVSISLRDVRGLGRPTLPEENRPGQKVIYVEGVAEKAGGSFLMCYGELHSTLTVKSSIPIPLAAGSTQASVAMVFYIEPYLYARDVEVRLECPGKVTPWQKVELRLLPEH